MQKIFKNLFILFISLFLFAGGQLLLSQNNDDEKYVVTCIGFYNVENLFDTINDPEVRDDDFTPEGDNRWNTEKYLEKLENLAEVIDKMGEELTPHGPAVLGLSEVENEDVLKDLAAQERIRDRNYQVVHYHSPDPRGMDVALMYQPKYFEVTSTKPVPTELEREDGSTFRTRDQLLVSGKLLGEPMHFIVLHWPSRRGGEKRSRPLRIGAAEVARGIVDSLKANDPDAKVIVMGDFNDDPVDISVKEYMKAKGDKNKLEKGDMYNPFVDFHAKGIGTLAWRDSWNLFDMLLLTQPFLDDDKSSWRYHRAEVFNRPFLRQPSGRFKGYPYRSYGGGVYLGGYSDHFPVYVFLIKEL